MTMGSLFAAAFASLLAAGPAASTATAGEKPVERLFDPEGLDTATLRTLAERGSVVIVDKDAKANVSLVTAGAVIDAPPTAVYAAATDYTHFKDFMPQVESAKPVDPAAKDAPKDPPPEGASDIAFSLKFKFSVITSSVNYVTRFRYPTPLKITFEHVAGDMKGGGGSYILVPLEGGTKTLLFYSAISDLRSMGFLTRTLLKEQPSMEPAIHVSTVSLVSAAIKKRAEAEHLKSSAAAPASVTK